MEPVVQQGLGGTISICHYKDEEIITGDRISQAAATVYDSHGQVIQQEISITPDEDGVMNISISALSASAARKWCRIRLQYSVDGIITYQDKYFHIASHEFDIPVHYQDILKFVPDLKDYAWPDDQKFAASRKAALWQLYARLINDDRDPVAIVNRSALAMVFLKLWLSIIYASFSKSSDDYFHRKSQDYLDQFEKEYLSVNLIDASDMDVNIADAEDSRLGRTKLRRG